MKAGASNIAPDQQAPPDNSHHAAVLTALKNKPCGRPLIKRPFLTAVPRDGSATAWAGAEG